MRPIHIKTFDIEEYSPESSHLWGDASLPEGMDWPAYTDEDGEEYDYTFIGQVNLKEIADLNPEGRLPHEGLLSFFGQIDHYLGDYDVEMAIRGFISEPEAVKVIWTPDTSRLCIHTMLDENGCNCSPEAMGMSFSNTKETLDEDHGLLVPPDHREWEQWEHPYEDWEILFQLDSFSGKDFDLNFMDVGVLDFLIDPKDLQKRDFSKVRAIVLST